MRTWCRTLLVIMLCLSFSAVATQSVDERLAQQMQVNQQRYGVAAQAVSITRNGKPLFRAASGKLDQGRDTPATADTVFPVYSLSKLFASVLVMQLVEQDKIRLDSPLSEHLPELPSRWRAITLRQFLNHNAGVPEYFSPEQLSGSAQANASFPTDLPALFAALADTPMLFAPGTDTRYTQTNYVVLAHLLETYYDKPYRTIVAERIIGRLQLGHTFLGRDALPAQGVATAYLGKNDVLEPQPTIAWPVYALGHADLYSNVDDLTTFLQAVVDGTLLKKSTLPVLWQAQTLTSGKTSGFAGGWEVGESEGYRLAGHDGGARVRVRILLRGSPATEIYTVVYLSSGSRRNVWSRVLLDSALAAVAPASFPDKALSEKLIGFATQAPDEAAIQSFAGSLRGRGSLAPAQERVINTSGYTIRANLGDAAANAVFRLNTVLFPSSANAWDSLAETYEALGDTANAQAARRRQMQLSGQPR
jgi:CubicO group peptidase (beta-lactamase class C family)